MTALPGLKAGFSRFFEADPERLHFAAHSHHPWPDVSYQAQIACWNDAARLADLKWDKLFGEFIPGLQGKVARLLGLNEPSGLAFGPNSHGFLLRLLSCLPVGRRLRVLTSDGEFHSLTRQLRRLAEDGLVEVTWVSSVPFESFAQRFGDAAGRGSFDLVYVSQVFFDSGAVLADLERVVADVWAPGRMVVIDGYHGFAAVPTDLAAVESRAFYLAGGYKYAMAGEGAALLYAPAGQGLRPRDTGWFADFGSLEAGAEDQVSYGPGGARFLGATFDPVGLYRLDAALDWLADTGQSPAVRLAHSHRMQALFVDLLDRMALDWLRPDQLVVPIDNPNRGHFLTFETADAGQLQRRLLAAKVITDARASRLRFGFGLYHDEDDVAALCRRLKTVK